MKTEKRFAEAIDALKMRAHNLGVTRDWQRKQSRRKRPYKAFTVSEANKKRVAYRQEAKETTKKIILLKHAVKILEVVS